MSILLPSDFQKQLQDLLQDEFADFITSLAQVPPVSIRFNPLKMNGVEFPSIPVPWAENAYYLSGRKSFTADPFFHAGAYYVQEASSMLLEQAYKTAFPDSHPALTLDLCAAPGGKSTHILSLLRQEGILISNEIHPTRNSILRQNLARWGHPNTLVTQLPPSGFSKLNGMLDLVVCDAPCSGEGLFRKDQNAIHEWSTENVRICAQRQTDILAHASELVKQGGFLVYSTCTYNHQENDHQIKRLLNSNDWEIISMDLAFSGAVQSECGWQCFPHKVMGEGFYITLLRRKNGSIHPLPVSRMNARKDSPASKGPVTLPSGYTLIRIGSRWHLIPEVFIKEINSLLELLPVKSAGIVFGEEKGRDLIPAPELALSVLDLPTTPVIELSLEQAQLYLRCDSNLILSAEKGWNLVSYKNQRLGWVKVLQGRINNYYPKNWRILKEIDRLF